MNWAAIIWLILMIFFIFVEASTVTVVSLWFAVGSLAAMIASLLGAYIWLQVVIFLVVSGMLLCALRPLVRKHFTPKLTRTNVDAMIGASGIVMQEINNTLSQGQVKIGGMEWTARSASGEPIAAGTQVKVDRVEGVKIFVTPTEITVSMK